MHTEHPTKPQTQTPPLPFSQRGFSGSAYGVSGSTLKLFAVITMLIDHTGAAVVSKLQLLISRSQYPGMYKNLMTLYTWMRAIGRLAFPVFCFLLVEGFFHTRSVKKYAARLFVFALLSEFPFDFALKPAVPYWGKQNVYFTLLIGLITLYLLEELRGLPWLQALAIAAGMFLADALMTDYGFKGVFLIVVLYLFRDHRLYQCFAGGAAIAWERWAPLSFLLCFLYNGKRGLRLRYLFYVFYPAHLLVLGLLRWFLLPQLFGA